MFECILVVAIVEFLFIGIVAIVIFIGSRNCLAIVEFIFIGCRNYRFYIYLNVYVHTHKLS